MTKPPPDKRAATFVERVGFSFADPAEEAAFADQYLRGSVIASQVFLVLGGLFYYGFFTWDNVIDPVGGATTHMIRGLIVTPIMFVAAALLFSPWAKRYFEFVILATFFVGQIGLVFVYGILASGYDYAAVGFILWFMGNTTAFPIRSKYLVIASLFAVASTVAGHLWAANAQAGWLTINVLALLSAIAFGSVSAWLRERAARRQFRTNRALETSRERVDDLLHSILPADIVQRIQTGETAIADSLGEVSIIFANLSGFSGLARNAGAADLMKLLNRIFSGFDREADRFGIDKIKTIGNAYMAIGGLARGAASHDHAENAADFALAIRAAADRLTAETGHDVGLRIGLHVGPVVAGVIGVRRPAFDCWGESVNLAARLESCAPPGGIQVSESAYWRLRQTFALEPGDEVELKGIGRMTPWLLTNRLATNDVRGRGGLRVAG